MTAAQDGQGRRAVAEDRAGVGDDGAAGELRPDEELPVGGAVAQRQREVDLAAGGVAGERLVVLAIDDARRRRVGQRADVTGHGQVRTAAKVAVAEELLRVAGGKPDTTAEAEREGVAVVANQPQVGAHAKVADSRAAIAHDALSVDDGAGRRPALGEGDGEADAQAQPLENDQRPADVQEKLVGDDAGVLGAVGVEDDVGLVPVVRHHADRGAKHAANVEGVVDEPFAPGLAGLEAIERQCGCGLRLRGARPADQGDAGHGGHGGQDAEREALERAFGRWTTFHGISRRKARGGEGERFEIKGRRRR